jgi:hypothetical protein
MFNFTCALSFIHESNVIQNLRARLQPLTKLYVLHDLSIKSNVDENCHTCAGAIPVLVGIVCRLARAIYGIALRPEYHIQA